MNGNSGQQARKSVEIVPASNGGAPAASGARRNLPAIPGQADNVISAQWTSAPVGRRRNRGGRIIAGLASFIILPAAVVGTYLYGYATDQYVSEFRFTVRQQSPSKAEASSLASAFGGGASMLATMIDSQVVVQYLKSRQAVDDISSKVAIEGVWSRPEADTWARLEPGAAVERKVRYWRNMVDPYFDMSSGVVTVKVKAFTAADAETVANAALAASELRVNQQSARSHEDAVHYSRGLANDAAARLKAAETALAVYRNQHQVLFPQMEAGTQAGVEGSLLRSLAEARARLQTLLSAGVTESTQVHILRGQISSMQLEVDRASSRLARPTQGGGTGSLASVASGADAAETEVKIAEKSYEHALSSYQDAENAANQQGVYLDAFVRPAEPQESGYPMRGRIMLETVALSLVGWFLTMLLWRGIRDHVD